MVVTCYGCGAEETVSGSFEEICAGSEIFFSLHIPCCQKLVMNRVSIPVTVETPRKKSKLEKVKEWFSNFWNSDGPYV
jgi:hypothetical protein